MFCVIPHLVNVWLWWVSVLWWCTYCMDGGTVGHPNGIQVDSSNLEPTWEEWQNWGSHGRFWDPKCNIWVTKCPTNMGTVWHCWVCNGDIIGILWPILCDNIVHEYIRPYKSNLIVTNSKTITFLLKSDFISLSDPSLYERAIRQHRKSL